MWALDAKCGLGSILNWRALGQTATRTNPSAASAVAHCVGRLLFFTSRQPWTGFTSFASPEGVGLHRSPEGTL